jgi:hypothetical protein
MFFENPDLLLGPFSGLMISLLGCGYFMHRFNKSQAHLLQMAQAMSEMHQAEISTCNKRFDFLLSEILKIKEAVHR